MSAAAALRRSASASRAALSLFDDMGGEPTLDVLIVGVWEGLTAHQSVACPVCAGRMEPTTPEARDGRCTDCGSLLS